MPAPRSHSYSAICLTFIATIVYAISLCAPLPGQESAQVTTTLPLIQQPVDESQLTTLKGNTHPLARTEFDVGTAPADLPMQRMLLVLKRSPAQETSLRTLLDNQQSKASANYHKWLTPKQYGQQFGPADSDMATITAWLQSHGFTVGSTKGRTVLEFSGTAGQVQEAFHTSIHRYAIGAELHWANSSDPMIPTALTPAVKGVLTLHNFIKKPAIHFTPQAVPAKVVMDKNRPLVTFPAQNGQPAINALGPQDYAVIYNINPVYSSNTGQGITVGVVGRSDLFQNGSDVRDFFNYIGFGNGVLGYSNIETLVNGPDPGDLGGGEEAEATLDSTWPGAVAPGAQVYLIASATTNTTDGVDLSEAYIIENNYADVMTESFSSCELYATDAQLAGQSAMAEQAAAQGITYLVSTGDSGSEGCDDPNLPPATHPISVNFLASTAFNIAVGGTMFNEGGDTSRYWTSALPFSETAISYIPEDVWNESSLSNGLWSSGGGASAGNSLGGIGGTTQGIPKPSWQYGVEGIPADGVRDLPDVSLTAASHDPYLLCLEASCEPNSQGELFVYFISGTSASTPSFAGIMALIDSSGQRQGLANYILYRLAATQSIYPSSCDGSSSSTPPSSTCIFNDVAIGDNVVPGEVGTDYQASPGYDLASGLGSVNVANLQSNWGTVTFNPTSTTLTLNGGQTVNITHGQPVPILSTVAPTSGTGTPTGDLSLFLGISNYFSTYPSSMETFQLSGGQVASSSYTLPGGSYNIWAHYAGDNTFAPSDSPSSPVTVTPESSTTTVSVITINQSGQSIPFTSGPYGSFVYLRADVAGLSGYGVPTGSVSFLDGDNSVDSYSPLNSEGNTGYGFFNFDTGTHTISASYSGDVSFNPSNTTQSPTFTITPGFYAAVYSTSTTVVIAAAGGVGTSGVNIFNSTNFSGTVSLACSGLPSEAACQFTPATVNANGTAATTHVTITVTTAAPTANSQNRAHLPAVWMSSTGLLLFSFVFLGGKRQRARGILTMLSLMLVLGLAPSCGGGSGSGGGTSNPGTPAGISTVLVTATSGSTVSTTGFTLVIQ